MILNSFHTVISILMVTGLTQSATTPADSQTLQVAAGQSILFDMPWRVQRMAISETAVADFEAVSPTQVMLLGRKVGTATLVIWGENGEIQQKRVEVIADLTRLRTELHNLFPDAELDVRQSEDMILITGQLSSSEQAQRLRRFLNNAEQATGSRYVDMTSTGGQSAGDPDASYLDADRLQRDLKQLFPDADLQVRQAREVTVISGVLRRVDQVEQLRKFLEAIEAAATEQRQSLQLRDTTTTAPADEQPRAAQNPSPGFKFVDMTTLAGVQQVQLQVRVAEVSRNAIRDLGINAVHTGHHDNSFFGGSTIGPDQGGAINPISIGPALGAPAGDHGAVPFVVNGGGTVSPLVTLFLGFPRADLQFYLQALAENQYLRLLAEPTLVALSGEEASFLAGGEFPIPVVQGSTGQSGLAITIEYKEFGVRLRFRPTVLGDGTIRLHVAPEVSDLTNNGAVEIQGFRVPALVTRRVETTLELKSGQTFSMAGLLNNRNEARNSRVPGLGDVPVLGALFRSVRYVKGETELVVLVTASLVDPLSLACTPPVPGMMDTVPNDWEVYAEGRTTGRAKPQLSCSDLEWLEKIGFCELIGPGAWEDYEQPSAVASDSQ